MPRIDFSLYLVTDRHLTGPSRLATVLDQALQAGVRAVQLREKDLSTRALLKLAEEVRRLTRRHGALLLINDRVDVAVAVEADGVHLRSDSVPVEVVRRLLGPDRIIGVSTHSAEAALQAEAAGADFVVLGPVFDTPSKRPFGPPIGLGPLETAARQVRLPILAIGGVTASRVPALRRAGASGAAVISSILGVSNAAEATREFLTAWSAPSG